MKVKNWAPDVITVEVEKAAMDRLERAAQIIVERAKAMCPVGIDLVKGKGKHSGRKSGALRDTIRAVRLKGDPKLNMRVYAGNSEVYYARFVEYGTVKMKAKPFLRPAFNAARAIMKAIIEGG